MKKGKSKLETVNQIKELLFDKLLIDMGRACDLVWMVFRDSAGENETVLHIQCPWRIIKGKKLLIGSRDIYETLPDINYDEWDVTGNSLFDKYLEEDFKPELPIQIKDIQTSSFGDIILSLEDNVTVELFVCAKEEIEHFRLISGETHLVFFEQDYS